MLVLHSDVISVPAAWLSQPCGCYMYDRRYSVLSLFKQSCWAPCCKPEYPTLSLRRRLCVSNCTLTTLSPPCPRKMVLVEGGLNKVIRGGLYLVNLVRLNQVGQLLCLETCNASQMTGC